MSGPIYGTTPWGRSAVRRMDPDARAVFQAQIPDGHGITVSAHLRPGAWIVRLVGPEHQAEARGVQSVEIGCERVLDAVKEKVG